MRPLSTALFLTLTAGAMSCTVLDASAPGNLVPMTVNEDPAIRPGWYDNTGGTLHAGAKGGLKLGGIELVLRAGVTKSERLKDLDLPFYATLGAAWRF